MKRKRLLEMKADISNQNARCSQPLKKRKIQVNDESNDNMKNNLPSPEEVDTNVKCEDKENEGILTQKFNVKNTPIKTDNRDEHSEASDTNQHLKTNDLLSDLIRDDKEDTNVVKNNNDNCKLTNSQSSLISIRKIEDLRVTPKKNVGLNELIDTKNMKTENRNNPQIFSPSSLGTNSMEWHSKTIKSLPETPPSCRKDKHCLNENNKSRNRKKRKISTDNDDYEQLSNTLKSEFYDTDLNDMEPIDMLHDLDSVMDFEDTKLSTNFLSSTTNDGLQNEYNMELFKDPQIDPLFIADNNEHDTTTEDGESGQIRKELKTKPNSKKRKTKQHNVTKRTKLNNKSIKSKSNTEDHDETYNIIKNILGELDIHSETENEELDTHSETENGELSDSSEQKLYDLEVQLMHEVPPQHKIEHTAGSKPLTKTEKQLFLKYGPLKRGVFSPNEDKIITNNWQTFCKVHNWNSKNAEPFLCMKHGNKFYIRSVGQRQKFVQFLANGLPWRSLYSVYHRFRKLNIINEKSFKRYTSAEDEKILSYMNSKRVKQKKKRSNTFSELGKLLGRTDKSIWLRYQLLKKTQENRKKKPPQKVKWTLRLINKFIKTFMDVTLCEEVEDLKDATIPKRVWQRLEKKLKIDYNSLKVFWMYQLHMQLFCPDRIYLNDIKIKLIEYIYGKGISNTREIIWPNVAKYFEGVTSVFLCRIYNYLVREAAIKLYSKNLPDIVEYLYHDKIHEIRNELTDKFLPRLSYNNGKVNIVHEDTSDNIKAH